MRRTIVSGYFNPMHLGHLRYIQDGKSRGDYLIVIVNNDVQQKFKKGKVIMNEQERVEITKELKSVDEVFLSIDKDLSVCKSIVAIREKYPDDELIFCNGGDRPNIDDIPESKVGANIKFEFGVGGKEKLNSSTNINQHNGYE